MRYTTHPHLQVESPQQANACDCGFFTVLNAEHVLCWMTQVLRSSQAGDGETVSRDTAGDPEIPLVKASFDKGDVGAYRALAFQALSQEWWDNWGGGDADFNEEAKRRVERQEAEAIPTTLTQAGCKCVLDHLAQMQPPPPPPSKP